MTAPAHDLIAQATHVFARGFALTRSFTHPFVAEAIGSVWWMHDAPRKSGNCRTEEFVGHRVTPHEFDAIARRHAKGRFALCRIVEIGEPDGEIRASFKTLGYRLLTTEPLMVQSLERIPPMPCPPNVILQRVLDKPMADKLAKAARARQMLSEHFRDDAPLRQYVALFDGEPIGWVRSISVASPDAGHATWCSSMYVRPQYRRQGIARALLSKMLHDDRDHGSKLAVLLASHAGALVYPLLGYQQIGTLLLLTPKKRN